MGSGGEKMSDDKVLPKHDKVLPKHDKVLPMAEIISQVMQKLNKLSPEDRARAVEVLASIYKGE